MSWCEGWRMRQVSRAKSTVLTAHQQKVPSWMFMDSTCNTKPQLDSMTHQTAEGAMTYPAVWSTE
jgi:hypothetical protein